MPLKRRGFGGLNRKRGMMGNRHNPLNSRNRQLDLQRKRENERRRREKERRKREERERKRRRELEKRKQLRERKQNESIRKAREKHKNFTEKQKTLNKPHKKTLTKDQQKIRNYKYKQDVHTKKIDSNKSYISALNKRKYFKSYNQKLIEVKKKENNRITAKAGIYKLKENHLSSYENLRKKSSDLTRSIWNEEKLLQAKLNQGKISPIEHQRHRAEILRLKKERQQVYFNQEKQKKLYKQNLAIQKQKIKIANLEEQKAKLNKKIFISPANKKARMEELDSLIEKHNNKLNTLQMKQENWKKRNGINERILNKKHELLEKQQQIEIKKQELIQSYEKKIKDLPLTEKFKHLDERDLKLQEMENKKKELKNKFDEYVKRKQKGTSSTGTVTAKEYYQQKEQKKRELQQKKFEEKKQRWNEEFEQKQETYRRTYEEQQRKNEEFRQQSKEQYEQAQLQKEIDRQNFEQSVQEKNNLNTKSRLEHEKQMIMEKGEFTEADMIRLAEIENELRTVG